VGSEQILSRLCGGLYRTDHKDYSYPVVSTSSAIRLKDYPASCLCGFSFSLS
jgi:hypothetical protein